MSRRRALLEVAAGAVLLSSAPVWVAVVEVEPTPAAFYRMVFGGFVLAALVLARRERLRASRPAALLAAVAGFFFALDLIFWHHSIRYIGPGLSTLLANFQVFLLAGYGVIVLREPAGWRLALAIPLALGGLVLLVGLDWEGLAPDYRLGVVLALLTAVSYATYLLFLRRSQTRPGRPGPAPNLAFICLASAIVLAVSTHAEGATLAIPDLRAGLLLAGYALTAQVFGWLLISRGIPHIEASRAGLLLLLQPSLAFLWDVLFFGRPAGPRDLAGAALALAAIYLGTARRSPGSGRVPQQRQGTGVA